MTNDATGETTRTGGRHDRPDGSGPAVRGAHGTDGADRPRGVAALRPNADAGPRHPPGGDADGAHRTAGELAPRRDQGDDAGRPALGVEAPLRTTGGRNQRWEDGDMALDLTTAYTAETIARARLDATAHRGWLAAQAAAGQPPLRPMRPVAFALGSILARFGAFLIGMSGPSQPGATRPVIAADTGR